MPLVLNVSGTRDSRYVAVCRSQLVLINSAVRNIKLLLVMSVMSHCAHCAAFVLLNKLADWSLCDTYFAKAILRHCGAAWSRHNKHKKAMLLQR